MQLLATTRQRGQEEAGTAAQIKPANRQFRTDRPVRHQVKQRLPHLLLKTGVSVIVTRGRPEAAGELGLVDLLETLMHGKPLGTCTWRARAQGVEQAVHILFSVHGTQGDAKARRADRHSGRANGADPDAAIPQPLGQLQGSGALPTSRGWIGVSLAPSRQPSASAPCRKRAINWPR